MTRRDPFTEIEDLFERMDRELEKLGTGIEPPRASTVAVDVDVIESDDEVVVLADLPGVDRDEIDVELRDDSLTIGATREPTHAGDVDQTESNDPDPEAESDPTDTSRYHLRERRYGTVSRRVPIPAPVETHGTTASYDAGVLTVTLPKRTADGSEGHQIDVS